MTPAAIVTAGIAALGLDPVPAVVERLGAYLDLMQKWNRVYNLTAIRDPQEMATHHLLDSLAVVPHLAGIKRMVDVGSGAGLPGVPLAIVCPGLEVISVETVGKKAAFQRQAKIELDLSNFDIHAGRIESFAPPIAADAVISRAFASLREFVELAGHCVRQDGRLLAMKGVLPEDELAALPQGWRCVAALALTVPGLDAQRHLIVLERD